MPAFAPPLRPPEMIDEVFAALVLPLGEVLALPPELIVGSSMFQPLNGRTYAVISDDTVDVVVIQLYADVELIYVMV
jgi:hypothetical protein